ncbi:MAG: hypothetical protein U0797_18975 [Gemmataceae bacterium]
MSLRSIRTFTVLPQLPPRLQALRAGSLGSYSLALAWGDLASVAEEAAKRRRP